MRFISFVYYTCTLALEKHNNNAKKKNSSKKKNYIIKFKKNSAGISCHVCSSLFLMFWTFNILGTVLRDCNSRVARLHKRHNKQLQTTTLS